MRFFHIRRWVADLHESGVSLNLKPGKHLVEAVARGHKGELRAHATLKVIKQRKPQGEDGEADDPWVRSQRLLNERFGPGQGALFDHWLRPWQGIQRLRKTVGGPPAVPNALILHHRDQARRLSIGGLRPAKLARLQLLLYQFFVSQNIPREIGKEDLNAMLSIFSSLVGSATDESPSLV